jgi:NAD(P)-dependent dehydrogenase (short-subunit alcohol dehydrogenase family)
MINRTIVVTGASRGIGKETVLLLASNPGNRLIALSRDLELMEQHFAHLPNVFSHRFDLNEVILPQAEKIFTGIEVVQVNFLGPVELIQFLSSRMEVNGAHVVNISTMGAFQGSAKFPELAAYASSKTALCNFTEVYAEENKDGNIQMNCLCLGAVQTEMLAEAFPGYIAKISAEEMADFISDFAMNKGLFFNGKIIPVSNSTP